ncbi:TPA: VENN motif pre-toxin domain-containing protein [Enterobacter roggenkampii]|nr:VENN motif pre-toxin domain-containing protein [Enterobacter roggenkampii]
MAAALTQLSGGSSADGLKAGAIGAITASAMTDHLVSALYGDKKSSDLAAEEKRLVSSLVSIAGGLAGAAVTDGSVSMAATASETAKVEVENNSLGVVIQGGKLAAQGCLKISACRDRLVGSGLGALLGIGASTSAMDTLSQDEQLHLIYVASLNDPSQLSQLNNAQKAAYESLTGKTITSTGGTQVINPGPSNTGGDQTVTGNVPSNTGNNKSSGQGATNTGKNDGNPDTGGNTTVTPIPEGPNKDDLAYLALKGKEAEEAAKKLGFDTRIPPQKAPFNSHGQPVYSDGKKYITPDIDSHNVTNGWKMFDRKGNRIGTYDSNLNRIKD